MLLFYQLNAQVLHLITVLYNGLRTVGTFSRPEQYMIFLSLYYLYLPLWQ